MNSLVATFKGPKPKTFSKCIELLKNQTIPLDQIIIVDGNLEGRTESESMQIGVKRAGGNVLFFTNLDCYVPNDWVERHLEWHDRFDLVSGLRINTGEYLSAWTAWHDSRPRMFQEPQLGITGSNISVKRSVLEKVGELKTPRIWDVELGIKAEEKGIRWIIDPNIVVLHAENFLSRRQSFRKALWISREMRKLTSGKIDTQIVLRATDWRAFKFKGSGNLETEQISMLSSEVFDRSICIPSRSVCGVV
jgi:glycosyltransferase involved in cell wall biosynthesis